MSDRVTSCPDWPRWRLRLIWGSEETPDGCWIWTGKQSRSRRSPGVYGAFRFGSAKAGTQRQTGAHRAAWLAWHGDIEGDLEVDHLCFRELCVNPDHLDLVTKAENLRRRRRYHSSIAA